MIPIQLTVELPWAVRQLALEAAQVGYWYSEALRARDLGDRAGVALAARECWECQGWIQWAEDMLIARTGEEG